MPHLILGYSRNLEKSVDIQNLCNDLAGKLVSFPIFQLAAIRVRAYGSDHYHIADHCLENTFLAAYLRIGEGRNPEMIKEIGEQIVQMIETNYSALFKAENFSFSFEIQEIKSEFSWKRNSIHKRLARQ